jgi:4-hydroxyphenylpyruvate dioxygenase
MTPPIPIRKIHHVELTVGNARLTAYFIRKALGLDLIAYRGPETGHPGSASYALSKGDLRIVVTAPLTHEDPRVVFLALHSDSVKDVAFEVEDLDGVCELLETRGARFAQRPHAVSDSRGTVRMATIRAFGDTVHTLVQRGGYDGPFLPGYEPRKRPGYDSGLTALDHFTVNVEDRQLDRWVEYYANVFGFHPLETWAGKDVQTDKSALHSQVITSGNGRVRISINEPAAAKRRSQVQEYVDYHVTAGVQHLGLGTADIVKSVTALAEAGVEFLPIPEDHYANLPPQATKCGLDRATLEKNHILVDGDDKGCLLQAYTRQVVDRPTLFLELIQRQGAESFGGTTFRTLVQAIEHEQERRGNL